MLLSSRGSVQQVEHEPERNPNINMDISDAEDLSAPDVNESEDCAPTGNTTEVIEQTRLKTTINDLPDEIILKIMSYEFVILGSDMYIYSFPGPAAVCQKWFMIYFEMYWRKWGFLKSKKATMEQWIRLARMRNGLSPEPLSVKLTSSAIEENGFTSALKRAAPPLAKILKEVKDTKSRSTSTPTSKPEPTISWNWRREITRLNTSDVRDSSTRDVWKTVIRRGRKQRSKPATSAVGRDEETEPLLKPAVKPKVVPFPFKIMRIMA